MQNEDDWQLQIQPLWPSSSTAQGSNQLDYSFLILFVLVAHEASLASWNLTSCRERQHHRRAAFKGCLPVTDVVGNRPRSGIIFLDVVCAWWLCCGSHGKSICSYDFRNALFDLLGTKHLQSTIWLSPFHTVSHLVSELVFLPDQQKSVSLQKEDTRCQFTVSFLTLPIALFIDFLEIFNNRVLISSAW